MERLPDDQLLRERVSVFARSIRALPDGMLIALAAGLDRHSSDLIVGRLYKSRRRGGCVVGVMLRELDPARFEHGPLRFWLLDRWRRHGGSYGGALRRNPRLRHIEWTFDAAVTNLCAERPHLSRAGACAAVGEAFGRAVAGELAWRLACSAAVGQSSPIENRSGVPA